MGETTQKPTIEERLNGAIAGMGRMGLWLVIAIVMLVIVYWLAPQMVKVSLYKLSLLPAATYVLYWIDRALNERRPHEYFEEAGKLREGAHAKRIEDPSYAETVDYNDALRLALELEHQGQKRLDRRTWFIAAGMIAVALGG